MNPLKHFLDSCYTYKEGIIIFISSFMFGVGLIYVVVKFILDIIEFELGLFLEKWKSFRIKK